MFTSPAQRILTRHRRDSGGGNRSRGHEGWRQVHYIIGALSQISYSAVKYKRILLALCSPQVLEKPRGRALRVTDEQRMQMKFQMKNRNDLAQRPGTSHLMGCCTNLKQANNLPSSSPKYFARKFDLQIVHGGLEQFLLFDSSKSVIPLLPSIY